MPTAFVEIADIDLIAGLQTLQEGLHFAAPTQPIAAGWSHNRRSLLLSARAFSGIG
jgi:hypothetical protein